MAIWDFRPKVDLVTGLAVGVGVAAAPVVMPIAWAAARPLLKALLKGGFILYETGRGTVAAVSGYCGGEAGQDGAEAVSRDKPALAQLIEGMREKDEEKAEKPTRAATPKAPAAAKPKRPRKKAVKKTEKEE